MNPVDQDFGSYTDELPSSALRVTCEDGLDILFSVDIIKKALIL